jgi:hypothetical protein
VFVRIRGHRRIVFVGFFLVVVVVAIVAIVAAIVVVCGGVLSCSVIDVKRQYRTGSR